MMGTHARPRVRSVPTALIADPPAAPGWASRRAPLLATPRDPGRGDGGRSSPSPIRWRVGPLRAPAWGCPCPHNTRPRDGSPLFPDRPSPAPVRGSSRHLAEIVTAQNRERIRLGGGKEFGAPAALNLPSARTRQQDN